jgi:hypothetical protein
VARVEKWLPAAKVDARSGHARISDRRVTAILAGLTLLVLVLSLPGSLRDAFNRGGIYVFSRAFFEDLPVPIVAPYSLTRALSPGGITSSPRASFDQQPRWRRR